MVPEHAGPLVALAGLSAGYGDRVLVRGLDLELAPGAWVGVRGPSGSGKSTLLGLVAGLADPLAGTLAVGGRDWSRLDRAARAEHRRRWLALAPQRPSLVESMTVQENLSLTAAVRGAATDPDEVAAALGLTALLDGPVAVLSGGERQRAALARALVSDAPVLVLDEPTSQQDAASAARVVSALRREVGRGRAVLVASHDPEVLAVADRVLRLDPREGWRLEPGGGVSRPRG